MSGGMNADDIRRLPKEHNNYDLVGHYKFVLDQGFAKRRAVAVLVETASGRKFRVTFLTELVGLALFSWLFIALNFLPLKIISGLLAIAIIVNLFVLPLIDFVRTVLAQHRTQPVGSEWTSSFDDDALVVGMGSGPATIMYSQIERVSEIGRIVILKRRQSDSRLVLPSELVPKLWIRKIRDRIIETNGQSESFRG